VTRDAVQDEHIMFQEPNPIQIQGYDLFSKGEVLVFEQEAELKHSMNEIVLLVCIGYRPLLAGNSTSKFRSEIEVMTPASEQAMMRNDITKWALADTGRAEEEDRVNGEGVRSIR
jgi:hypothetical protein